MTQANFLPQGTVYGTLLNFRSEWNLWQPRMALDPHKAPPQAPVLYVKSANTFCPAGLALQLQDGIRAVEIGATLGLVMGTNQEISSAILLNDWSVPHSSYYRPPIKYRNRDGYLALAASPTPIHQLADLNSLKIEVTHNAQTIQTIDLGQLVRPVQQLLTDVLEFMPLQAGDVLMVGSDVLADDTRPLAKAGDQVCISATGFTSVNTKVEASA